MSPTSPASSSSCSASYAASGRSCSKRSARAARSPMKPRKGSAPFSTNSPAPSPRSGSLAHAQLEGSAEPHPQRPLDAEDHLGDEGGRRLPPAPRPGAGGSRPPLCAAHETSIGLVGVAHGGATRGAASVVGDRQG